VIYNDAQELDIIAEISYTYNDQGIRIGKIIEDNSSTTKHEYKLTGDLVIAEIVSQYNNSTQEWDLSYKIAYNFDYDGSPIGFTYFVDSSKTDYIYVKNQFGDITHITLTNGYVVVQYQYDSYGNIINIDGSSQIGQYNIYRYRGYKYDKEISLYYLNSRYYNPEIGRFINADGLLGQVGNLQSTNMYAYCANNPVMYIDPSGYFVIVDDMAYAFCVYLLFSTALIIVLYIVEESGMLNDFNNFLIDSKRTMEIALAEISSYLSSSISTLYSNVLNVSKKSKKEKSTRHPSYTNRGLIDKTLNAHQNATNMMNNKWGKGNWGRGPGSDYNQIVKWIIRGQLLKEILMDINNNEIDDDKYYIFYDYFGR